MGKKAITLHYGFSILYKLHRKTNIKEAFIYLSLHLSGADQPFNFKIPAPSIVWGLWKVIRT